MSAPKKPSSIDLKKQETKAKATLDALRQKQVDALEDGREFEQNSEILIETEKLAALAQAISRAESREEHQRQLDELEETRVEGIGRIRAIHDAERARLLALTDVEHSVVSMVATIQRYQELSEHARLACRAARAFYSYQPLGLRRLQHLEYTTDDIEMPTLRGQSVAHRLGKYMASAMSVLTTGSDARGQFGGITWDHGQALEQPWSEVERSALDPEINGEIVQNLEHIVASIAQDGGDGE